MTKSSEKSRPVLTASKGPLAEDGRPNPRAERTAVNRDVRTRPMVPTKSPASHASRPLGEVSEPVN